MYTYTYIYIDIGKNEHGFASGMLINLSWMFIPHISAEFLRRPALARRWLTREGPNH